MTKVVWSGNSLRDLENIHAYVALDSTVYADRLVAKLIESAETAAAFPFSGRMVPEVQNDRIRELIVGNYRVIYQVFEDRVSIVTVVHAGRDLTQGQTKPWEVT
jgi:toxin ParE1/3/4